MLSMWVGFAVLPLHWIYYRLFFDTSDFGNKKYKICVWCVNSRKSQWKDEWNRINSLTFTLDWFRLKEILRDLDFMNLLQWSQKQNKAVKFKQFIVGFICRKIAEKQIIWFRLKQTLKRNNVQSRCKINVVVMITMNFKLLLSLSF